jgi:hypothetical protein
MIGLALFTVLSLQGAGEPSAEAGDDRMGFHSTEGFVALITTIVGVPKRGHFDAKPARRCLESNSLDRATRMRMAGSPE